MQIKSIIETNTRLEGELPKASKLMLQNISDAKEQVGATASSTVAVLGLGSLLGLFLLYRIIASSEKVVAEAKAKAPAVVTEEAASTAEEEAAAAAKATAAAVKATAAAAKATVAAKAASAAAAKAAAAKVAPAGEKSE